MIKQKTDADYKCEATALFIYKIRDKTDRDDHPIFRFATVQLLHSTKQNNENITGYHNQLGKVVLSRGIGEAIATRLAKKKENQSLILSEEEETFIEHVFVQIERKPYAPLINS